jgi:hypothetical protein
MRAANIAIKGLIRRGKNAGSVARTGAKAGNRHKIRAKLDPVDKEFAAFRPAAAAALANLHGIPPVKAPARVVLPAFR